MSNDKLLPTIIEAGYCCFYGFLAAERAKGQTPQTLSRYWGFEASTFRHHFAQLDFEKRSHRCKGAAEGCMKEDVALLLSEKSRS